jgi:hypothetical protein
VLTPHQFDFREKFRFGFTLFPWRRADRSRGFGRRQIKISRAAAGDDDGPFNYVLQFPDVAVGTAGTGDLPQGPDRTL